MTAKIIKHDGKYGVECGATGAFYEPLFPKATAERVAELIDQGCVDWVDVEPVLEREGFQILA